MDEAADEDVLEIGRPGTGRLARLLAAVDRPRPRRWATTAAALAVLGLAATSYDAPTVVAGRGATHLIARPPSGHDTLDTVRGLAEQPGTLTDYLRQTSAAGACRTVPIGGSPGDAIVRLVQRVAPGYRLHDVSRTIDQFTGLCSIEVRTRYRSAVLTVTVTSPTSAGARRLGYTHVETGIETDAYGTTKYVNAATSTGWTVLVGATGPAAELPGVRDLLLLTEQPSLQW